MKNSSIGCCVHLFNNADDTDWLADHQEIFVDCFQSMINRDHPDLDERDGVMSLDSTRCGEDGWEITTYDSLDPSLGQASIIHTLPANARPRMLHLRIYSKRWGTPI